jgi:pilus assembly protein CpaB
MGGLATWLPEGRWVPAGSGTDPDPAAGHRPAGARRRIAAARTLSRLAGWPRRALAVGLLLTAVVLALAPDRSAVGPPAVAPEGTPVVVAGRDLAAGSKVSARDVRVVAMPSALVPSGAARQPHAVVGRVVAGALRRGETVTDARLVGPGLTAGLDPREYAAVPVRLADPEAAALVRPGDRVDVLGATVEQGGAEPLTASRPGTPGGAAQDAAVVASGVRVLAVLRGRDAADGVLLVVAAPPSAARRLVGAAARQRLTVAVRPP